MRLHTDHLTSSDIHAATVARGMRGVSVDVESHGSRSRARSFDVRLTGTSTRRPNPGTGARSGDDYAATWDEWGMFLAELFTRDPELIAGHAYNGADAFHAATGDRFVTLTADAQHRSHYWQSYGIRVELCTCGAVRRF